MKELLNKLREANLPITKEDFINACNQSSLFTDYIEELEDSNEEIKMLAKGLYEYKNFNLYLMTYDVFANVISNALMDYARRYIPDIYIAEAMADTAFGVGEDCMIFIEDDDYQPHVNSMLIDLSDRRYGVHYYKYEVIGLTVENGFSKVNLDGTPYILLG